MRKENKFYLKPSCILTVPLEIYDNDFLFIVNGEEFKTSRLVSDLLSPVICKNHLNDPTSNTFVINTHEKGDFSHILELVKFNYQNFSENELPFIIEVIEQLCNNSIEIENDIQISIDNVFSRLKYHEKRSNFFSQQISKEIEFISSHFNELCESHIEEFNNLSIDMIYEIINDDQLTLKSEDQLLKFVNFFYSQNSRYSVLYELVYFENVSSETIKEFLQNYDINDMSGEIWNRLSKRLEQEIKQNQKSDKNQQTIKRSKKRYVNSYDLIKSTTMKETKGTLFCYSKGKEFNGIFNYLNNISNGQIESEVSITASSCSSGRLPINVVNYNVLNNFFCSNDSKNSWLKFNLKNHKVKPSFYTIKSRLNSECSHPKSWVIEGSNDDDQWEILDKEIDCELLKGSNIVHTFSINNISVNEFQYIRMRLIDKTWRNTNCLTIESFEIYGILI